MPAIAVSRNGTDLFNCLGGFARRAQRLQLSNGGINRLVDAALEIHWVHARSDGFEPFEENGFREHGRCRRTVAGDVRSMGSHFLDHLRAHILEVVFELDFLGDRNAVFGHSRRPVGFVQ